MGNKENSISKEEVSRKAKEEWDMIYLERQKRMFPDNAEISSVTNKKKEEEPSRIIRI